MALSRARRDRGVDYWPGFVDALSTLILGIIFLLTVFVVVQFVLSQEVTGKDTALSAPVGAHRAAHRSAGARTDQQDRRWRSRSRNCAPASRPPIAERDRYKGLYEGLSGGNAAAQDKANELTGKLDAEKQVSLRALAQVEVLNQQIAALRRQLGALEQALEVSEKKDKDSQSRLADLGQRLNVALAQRVQELSRYRSDFFGRLREILGNRPDIRVVGDRFVLQSEVFFDTGQSVLKPEGRAELDKIAAVLLDVTRQIPQDIDWVLRVDGHTDVRPIGGGRTNWDLSAARAIAVVQYLISKGMPPQRLVAAGFGEFQPIDPANTEEAYSRNRRIELKLTER